MGTTWIRAAYAAVLAMVLALTVGFGVAVFEAGPRPPQPPGLTFSALGGNTTDQESTRISNQIDSFYDGVQTYRGRYPNYQRNMFLWLGGVGMLLAAIGIGMPAIVNYLRLGFILGGVLLIATGTWIALQPVPVGAAPPTGILALISAGTPKVLDTAGRFLRFAISVVGLLVLLFMGLWRLTEWSASGTRTTTAPVSVPDATSEGPHVEPVAAVHTDAEALKWARPDERVEATVAVPSNIEPAAAPEPPVVEPPQGL
jgi:hypothetical protein